ncbi:CBS domain-containing protein [Kitasatospora sp. DSM 101779]|uniref:CBS domain-containing protein n=1 Tax=Kitasatospora sp. DSM 101779 TaxID=2853165 RepID=UPI0021D7EF99|nr:CBS domain-containing protein [Kitasatospora sp. DSM 101779]MCU7821406.1 CBS domain-containing protein [Kitasatospora sp. DSM 101779]
MGHRTVESVMTRDVVRVAPETGFREIVALLAEFDITAVPVVDAEDRPVGIVSEADLLRTLAAQEDDPATSPTPDGAPHGGPNGGLNPGRAAVTAAELMTGSVLSTTPGASVVAAARLMTAHGVKRLPVVDTDGRLAGLVSRGDLLRVFLREDRLIHREIVEEVLGKVDGVSPALVGVEVVQGRVVLSGTIETLGLAPHVVRLCRSVDGVVSVTDRTTTGAGTGPGPVHAYAAGHAY